METNSEQNKEIKIIESLEKTEIEGLKAKSRKISQKEACAYSFMDGFGLRYITPFAVEIGKNSKNLNTYVGLLTALPSLLGSLSQLLTIKAMNSYSRRKIVFWGVFLQALMWLPLVGLGLFYYFKNINAELGLSSLVIIYTLLIIVGSFAGPAWSSMMKDTVTKDIGKYFGNRSRIAGLVALVCMLIAGFILDYFKQTNIFLGFIIIFFIAFLGRTTSSLLFSKQYEPKFKQEEKSYFSFIQFAKKMLKNNFGKFVVFFALTSLAVTICSPFFAVYVLKDLGFTYVQYMAMIVGSSVASFIFMSGWGKFADNYGNLKVMKLSMGSIIAVPFLYFASYFVFKFNPSLIVPYIIFIEVLAGVMWAGFNLAAGNFIYEAVTREKMALCVSYFNVINGIGTFIGPILGGFLASIIHPILGISALLIVFVIGGIARLVVAVYMLPKIKEVREVKRYGFKEARESFQNLSLREFAEYLDINPIKTRPI